MGNPVRATYYTPGVPNALSMFLDSLINELKVAEQGVNVVHGHAKSVTPPVTERSHWFQPRDAKLGCGMRLQD
jgi:hypothetical protein